MREVLGLLALDALYLAAGYSLLRGIGLVRSAGGAAAAAGLALVTGWAAVGVAVSWALMAGARGGAITICVASAAVAAAGAALAPRLRALPPAPPPPAARSVHRLLAAAGGVGVVVALTNWLLLALVRGADTNYDTWAFWLPKAKAIYAFGGLDTGPGGFTSYANPEYPPMIPALASAAYHFMGADDGRWLPLQQWIVGAGFIGAVAFLLRRRVPAHVLLPALALLLYAPAFGVRFTSVLADQQVAYLLALAGVTGALWLVEGPRRWLVPAALFLGAASLAKTEGLLLGGLLALGLCAVALASRPRRLEPLVLVGAVAAAILPWKLWLAANDQPLSSQLYSWSKLVHPRYLADRLDRLGFASRTMAGFLFAESKWLLVLPLVLLAVVLAARLRPGLALLVVAWLGVGFVGLAAVYWISPLEIHYYVDTSAERVASTLAIFAGTLLPLLVAEATRRE